MKKMKRFTIVATMVLVATGWSARTRAALGATPFYEGKTVTILAGTAPGGGYDLYARLLMRHMGRHLPGNPQLVVENMDGAGGLIAANHLYNRVKPDGLTFMIFNHIIIIRQLVGDPNVRLDVRKMDWIGTASDSPNICVVRNGAKYRSFQQMIGAREPVILAATPSSTREYYPKLVAEVVGANFKIITGYKSGGSIYVAVENGEADGACGIGWDSLKVDRPQWVKGETASIFLQLNPVEKIPDLPNVPWIMDYVKNPGDRQLIEAGMGTQAIVRSFVAPPGVPRERVEVLRKAFMETMNDPELKSDAAKTKSDLHVHPGAKVQEMINQWFTLPQASVQKIRNIYFPSGF